MLHSSFVCFCLWTSASVHKHKHINKQEDRLETFLQSNSCISLHPQLETGLSSPVSNPSCQAGPVTRWSMLFPCPLLIWSVIFFIPLNNIDPVYLTHLQSSRFSPSQQTPDKQEKWTGVVLWRQAGRLFESENRCFLSTLWFFCKSPSWADVSMPLPLFWFFHILMFTHLSHLHTLCHHLDSRGHLLALPSLK